MMLFDMTPQKEPVLISACLLGIPCRYHGNRAKRRDDYIEKLKEKYILIPVCPEQLGGMPTPRTSEYLPAGKTGADVLDHDVRLIAPETGEDVTQYHIQGGQYTLEIAQITEAKRAYLKGGSPSCDKEGITGEILARAGIRVIRVA
ncbi:MAG: DUF523 domain-containing protein [Planctomycetia bacterium]|nr:DUF523 domain-containing protein [Planctomycetia bacterium]